MFITPPHVNTTAGRKNASGVCVDRRLELLLMRQLPTLCEGEMHCCELELRNTGPHRSKIWSLSQKKMYIGLFARYQLFYIRNAKIY